MGTWDYLNKPLGEVLDDIVDAKVKDIEQKNFEKNCLPVVTFDRCVQWAKTMEKEYPQAGGFVIAVKDNPDPRNENDKLCVIVALIDENNKPISMDGAKGISTIFHGGTIDSKMIDSLNGNQSARYKFK